MDQTTVINALNKFRKGNYRRFFAPEYADQLWIGRQTFHRVINKVHSINWYETGVMQSPVDLISYMECIIRTRPHIIIETGTAVGGGALFYADILRHIHGSGNFRIITIEIDPKNIRQDLKSVPEIISIIGNSTEPEIIDKVYSLTKSYCPNQVMVTLDSDHSDEHVARELGSYADIVSPGQYLIVQDTYLGLYWGGNVSPNSPDAKFDYNGSPLAAVEAFLSCDDRYEVDLFPQRWIITQCPFGFLRRKS